MEFEDYLNEVFDSLYGEQYININEIEDYYSCECNGLKNELIKFYKSVNYIFELNTEDIMKQLLRWAYEIGGRIDVDDMKLYGVSKNILEWLRER